MGSIVLCNNFRNPALVAKMSANLQSLCDGRFILGIGADGRGMNTTPMDMSFRRPRLG